MLTVTQPALDRLSRRLARQGAGADTAVRLTRRNGGWKLRLDAEAAGDTVFFSGGRKVLLLDADVSKAMVNATLETRTTHDQRARLRLRREKHEA